MKSRIIAFLIEGIIKALRTGKENFRLWAAWMMLERRINMDKKWWESKTIILAALQLIGGIVTAYFTHNPTWAYGASAKSALDIALRLVTDSSIS